MEDGASRSEGVLLVERVSVVGKKGLPNFPVKRRVRRYKRQRAADSSKCISIVALCETGQYSNYPLTDEYGASGKSEIIKIGRHLGTCGGRTFRLLASRLNLRRQDGEPMRPRTTFKRVGFSVNCGQFQRFNGRGICVSFNVCTVSAGWGGVLKVGQRRLWGSGRLVGLWKVAVPG